MKDPKHDREARSGEHPVAPRRPYPHWLQQSFDMAPIGMALCGLDGTFQEVNQAFCDTLGYARDELLGMRLTNITHPDDIAVDLDADRQLLTGELSNYERERRFIARDGAPVHTLLRVGLIRDHQGVPIHFLSQIVDISKRIALEADLRYNATHDPLTGLHNRTSFMQTAEGLLQDTTPFALLFLDLDEFKLINESLGHQAGDRLLRELAQRILENKGGAHHLARLGGDEFALLLEGVREPSQALEEARDIQDLCQASFTIAGEEVFTTVSVGITLSLSGYEHPAELLRDADSALYRAKSQGRSRLALFDRAMHAAAIERLQLENDIQRALKRDEFRVLFQPIVRLPDAGVVGFEALARWEHPQRGLLSPAHFLSVSQETGHIVPIGHVLLSRVCATLRSWLEAGAPDDTFVSVNFSHREFFHPSLIQNIETHLERYELRPENLHVEITESVMMQDESRARELLDALRRIGLELYIDDFGTGYSSLAHLYRFPFQALKIDRHFIQRLGPGGENLHILRAISSLAANMNLEVIAEGIEEHYQLELLSALDCHYGQGYLFGRPLTPDAALRRILSSDTP